LPDRYLPYQTCQRRIQRWVRSGVIKGILKNRGRPLFSPSLCSHFKLIGAIKVSDVTADPDQLAHEMLLVKVGVNVRTRQEVVNLADLFKARIVDISTTTLMLQAAGEPDKLDKFLEVLRPFGIKEQARTGAVFMSRGAKVLNQRPVSPSDRKYLAE